MDIAEALSQLADIYAPSQPGWWPLAPAWWLLLAVLLALAAYGLFKLVKRLHLQRRLSHAVAELDKCLARLQAGGSGDMAQRLVYVNEVNSVLRRVALAHFPRTQVAGLSGQAWVEFLRERDTQGELTPNLALALAQGRFAPSCDIDTQALHSMARSWIKGLYMARIDTEPRPTSTATEHHA
jgi:hypothetical protein